MKGGCAGDAFVTLTGGVEEDLMLDKVAPPELFSRLDNAIRAGAILACSVPVSIHGVSRGAGQNSPLEFRFLIGWIGG